MHSLRKPFVVAQKSDANGSTHSCQKFQVRTETTTIVAQLYPLWEHVDNLDILIAKCTSAKHEIPCHTLLCCIPHGNPMLCPRKVMQGSTSTAAIVSFPFQQRPLQEVPLHFPMAKGLPLWVLTWLYLRRARSGNSFPYIANINYISCTWKLVLFRLASKALPVFGKRLRECNYTQCQDLLKLLQPAGAICLPFLILGFRCSWDFCETSSQSQCSYPC